MKAIGPLMWEHRLIERVIALMKPELRSIREGRLNTQFIDAALDFFRTYAERLHFGKEESILFAGLRQKGLSAGLGQIMAELIDEHARLKEKVSTIISLRGNIESGGSGQLGKMVEPIEYLLELYPSHTEKEDKRFFFPCLEYLSQEEQDKMLEAFQEFDGKLLHERYQEIVAGLENEFSGR